MKKTEEILEPILRIESFSFRVGTVVYGLALQDHSSRVPTIIHLSTSCELIVATAKDYQSRPRPGIDPIDIKIVKITIEGLPTPVV